MHSSNLKSALKSIAKNQGFDDIGIAGPEMLERHSQSLNVFLEQNWHGEMIWMAEKKERRQNPTKLWPDVKSVIMLAMNYGPDEDPLPQLKRRSNGVISVYAKGKDYHTIIKKKLKNIAGWFVEQTGAEVKVFVDTAPLMEKPLAMQAGLGWQGKHTNLVSREFGSWVFLGAILTSFKLEPDETMEDHCGSCQKCLDVCPTSAFPRPYQLNASRCISYLTIEHKSIIPLEFRKPMGNRIFGCDDCLAVCPWNKFAKQASETRFFAREAADNPQLSLLLALTESEFRENYAGSPIKRTGHAGFLRNCLIAAGNSNDKNLIPHIERLLVDDKSPVVRATAVWALGELASNDEIANTWASNGQYETEDIVNEEWQLVRSKIK